MNCIRHHTDLGRFLRKISVAAALIVCVGEGNGAAASNCFSTALVFAIDASGSVDDREYLLQMGGLSRALREPEVAEAIQRAGGIALAAVVWSDTAFGVDTVGWHSVRSAQDIEQFAVIIENLPRAGGGGTDMGQGVWTALDLLDDPTLCAIRRAVDVSGDGKETLYPRRRHGVSMFSAHRRAEEDGIIINGLAIVDEEEDLEHYYREKVISGASAFVIVAEGFADFATAMRAKLLREITPTNLAQMQEMQSAGDRPN